MKLVSLIKKFKSIFTGLLWIYNAFPTYILFRLLIAVLQGILPVFSLYIIKLIIDKVSVLLEQINEFTTIPSTLILWISLLGFTMILEQLLNTTKNYIGKIHNQKLSDFTQLKIQEKSLTLDVSVYENSQLLDLIQKVQQESNHKPAQLLDSLFEIIRQSLTLLSILGLLLFFHWSLLLLLIISTLPTAILELSYSFNLFNLKIRHLADERKARYFHALFSKDNFLKDGKIYQIGKFFQNRFATLRNRIFQSLKQILKQHYFQSLGVKIVEISVVIGTLLFLVRRAIGGFITIGDLVMYYQAFQRSRQSTEVLMRYTVSLFECLLYFDYFDKFLKLESEFQTGNLIENNQNIQLQKSLKLQNVCFTYPNTTRTVLKNINMELEKGKIYAIVGHNGSGKTTLLKLLCRFYEVSSGKILMDSINIKQLSIKAYQKNIALQSQRILEYPLSTKEFLQLGNISKPISDEQLHSFGNKIEIHEKIMSFDNKYDTILSRKFKDGETLSWGQWQKLYFAKTIYKNSDILILDEPTSAIDTINESYVYNLLNKIKEHKIIILSTHRLYNLAKVDKIFILDEGKIVESGHHNQLINRNGIYAKMANYQLV